MPLVAKLNTTTMGMMGTPATQTIYLCFDAAIGPRTQTLRQRLTGAAFGVKKNWAQIGHQSCPIFALRSIEKEETRVEGTCHVLANTIVTKHKYVGKTSWTWRPIQLYLFANTFPRSSEFSSCKSKGARALLFIMFCVHEHSCKEITLENHMLRVRTFASTKNFL